MYKYLNLNIFHYMAHWKLDPFITWLPIGYAMFGCDEILEVYNLEKGQLYCTNNMILLFSQNVITYVLQI
jgi:hypothetical protein